jgi:hypothetical protein
MSTYFTGTLADELDETSRWDPRNGKTRIRHWKGDPSSIGVIEYQVRQLGYAYTTHRDGGYVVISVDYPEDTETDSSVTPLSDEWEADVNYIQKDLWTLPAVQVELLKIGPPGDPTVRGFFRRDLESLAGGNPTTVGTDGSEVVITLEILLGSATVGQSGSSPITGVCELYGADPIVFLDVFDAMTRGVSAYEISRCVLRNTKITNKTSTITASRTNVDRIHTAANINALLPIDVKVQAPTMGYYLKKHPTVALIERGKWEIVQEYWHADDYEPLIYGAPVA